MTKRRSQNAVSLFPFLAVLVCTMGALILLLLVTTRRIRQKQEEVATIVVDTAVEQRPSISGVSVEQMAQAQAQLDSAEIHRAAAEQKFLDAEQQHQSMIRERNDLRNDLETLQATLRDHEALQKTQAADLTALQQKRSALQTELTDAEKNVVTALEALRLAEAGLAEAEAVALADEQLLAQQHLTIERLRKQRQKNLERVVEVGTKQTVIEFTGSRGTARTPIIVDVNASGFLFPTSGVRIRRKDLAGFSVSDNPLLAAVLCTHRHRTHDSIVSRPYVLLLVRPSGILDFYPAQRVLNNAHIHFGYELLSEEKQVAAADPMDGEAEAVRAAVLNAISRRHPYLAGSSDIRERIAALRAKEAVRKRQTADVERHGQDQPIPNWADDGSLNPVVRTSPPVPVPHEDDVTAKWREGPTNGWHERHSERPARSTLLQEPRSIQQLLNPAMDIERSVAEAVAARQTKRNMPDGHIQSAPIHERFPDRSDGDSFSGQQPTPHSPEVGQQRAAVRLNDAGVQEFWQNIDQQQPPTGSRQTGSPIVSGGPTPSSPQNNLPPVDGKPFQSLGTTQRSTSSDAGRSGRTIQGKPESASDSQSSELDLTYYEPVTVYLDPQYFTVAGEDPVPVHGATVSAILRELLDNIDKVIHQGPQLSFVRCLPVVKFVVSPGAHTLYLQIADGLYNRGIPAASVVSMESHVEEHSNEPGAALKSLDPQKQHHPSTFRMEPVSELRELP